MKSRFRPSISGAECGLYTPQAPRPVKLTWSPTYGMLRTRFLCCVSKVSDLVNTGSASPPPKQFPLSVPQASRSQHFRPSTISPNTVEIFTLGHVSTRLAFPIPCKINYFYLCITSGPYTSMNISLSSWRPHLLGPVPTPHLHNLSGPSVFEYFLFE